MISMKVHYHHRLGSGVGCRKPGQRYRSDEILKEKFSTMGTESYPEDNFILRLRTTGPMSLNFH